MFRWVVGYALSGVSAKQELRINEIDWDANGEGQHIGSMIGRMKVGEPV